MISDCSYCFVELLVTVLQLLYDCVSDCLLTVVAVWQVVCSFLNIIANFQLLFIQQDKIRTNTTSALIKLPNPATRYSVNVKQCGDLGCSKSDTLEFTSDISGLWKFFLLVGSGSG